MQTVIDITKALSDQNRVRALMLLTEGCLCVCQIIEVLGIAPSTTSKHMSILKQAGLVNSTKDGRWINYSLPVEYPSPEAQHALEWIINSLKDDSVIIDDKQKLKQVLDIDKEELCRTQRG